MIGAALLLGATFHANGPLVLRGSQPTPDAVVLRVDADGVLVRWQTPATGTEVLPLSSVRRVESSEQGAWADVSDAADALWRADSRLARGDFVSAEPTFEQLFATYRTRPGATGLVVAEGLLRCRLARHAHAGAIDPWIAWLACGGNAQSADDRHAAGIGPSTTLGSRNLRLFAALPPIWDDSPSTRAVAESVQSLPFPEATPPAMRHLRDLYAEAAAFELDNVDRDITIQSGGDPVLALVREIVASRAGKDLARAAARESLRRRISAEGPGWLHAWCRVAIARSLLREPEIEEQRRAIIELIAVHAFHATDSAFLAGMALAEAARACERIGDAPAARAIWLELIDRYPGHPSIDANVLRTLRPGVARTTEASPSSSHPDAGTGNEDPFPPELPEQSSEGDG